MPLEIVPGITAALGAAAQLQIPLTDRRFAKRVQFVTGHSEKGVARRARLAGSLRSLDDHRVLHGVPDIRRDAAEDAPAGLIPATPAAAITSATTDRTAARSGTAAELPVLLKDIHPTEPCLIVLGRVLENRAAGGSHRAAVEGGPARAKTADAAVRKSDRYRSHAAPPRLRHRIR